MKTETKTYIAQAVKDGIALEGFTKWNNVTTDRLIGLYITKQRRSK